MSDATHNHDLLTTLNAQARELRKHIPDVYQGFAATHKAAMAEGALPTKVKELIALAIGVTNRCDGCIASHARGAARAGATKEEAAEAMGVSRSTMAVLVHRSLKALKRELEVKP